MTPALESRVVPRDDDSCGWLAQLEAVGETATRAPSTRIEGDQRADALVVGAGLVGLAAARRLAELEPGWRIVMLDAQRAGFGASARSSGFVVDIAFFTTAMGSEAAERHVRLCRAGIDSLRRSTDEHAIDCAWDDRGWVHAAAGDEGLRDLEVLARWLGDHGESYEDLDRTAMEAVTGTPFYRRGVRLPGRPLVQPAALLRGLAAALPGSVDLYEGSPVRALDRSAGSWRARSDHGSVNAPRVVLALNGYAPLLSPARGGGLGRTALGRRVFPLVTFGSLTRRLTTEEQKALGGESEWGLLAQDPMGSSLRRTRDQRILVRNTLHYSRDLATGPAVRERALRAHRGALARRWPQLFGPSGIELEHTWAGVMGASASRRHLFERLDEGLYAAAGFTGAGIALGTVAGELMAEWATDRGGALLDDMRALPQPGRTPPEPFLSLGVRFKVARMNATAGETL